MLESAKCVDNPLLDSAKPAAGFDTISGYGSGRYNGAAGARVEFIFTDGGEPGRKDSGSIRVWEASGAEVLNVNGSLNQGNQQAHPQPSVSRLVQGLRLPSF